MEQQRKLGLEEAKAEKKPPAAGATPM